MSTSPRATGPVRASAGPSVARVVERCLHERQERLEWHTGRRGKAVELTEQRHDMIRGDARGGVVSPTIGDAERMEPEIGREVDDPFGSVDRRPTRP